MSLSTASASATAIGVADAAERQAPDRMLSVSERAVSDRAAWREARLAMESGRLNHRADGTQRRRRDWFDRFLKVGGMGLRASGLFGRGLRNALDIDLVQADLTLPRLPAAFDGYRILQISDPHLDHLPELGRIAATLLQGLEVDLMVLTGDYRGDVRGPFAASLAPLPAILEAVDVRDGRFAILGNHDSADMVGPLEAMGLTLLLNEHATIARDGQSLHITGVDDVHHFHSPHARMAVRTAAEGFRLALVHSPEIADVAAAAGIDLYLCGHTHGGQICLPGGRPIVRHLRRCRAFAAGTWRCGDMVGRTSSGLGVSGLPVRFNCRGEIALLTLRRAAAGSS